jgi:hypothetical protein
MVVQRFYKVAADLRAAISINESERVTERLDFGTMADRRSAAAWIGEGSL